MSGKQSGLNEMNHGNTKRQKWVIRPFKGGFAHQISMVWNFRHLYGFLGKWTTGQIYRQAALGVGWLIIQPLVLALSSVLVFGEMLEVSTKPIPLPLFVIISLSYWFLFRRSIQWMTKNLAMWRGILTRFYIPPLLLLLATLFPVLLEFSVILCVAFLAVIYFAITTGTFPLVIGWNMFVAIPALAMAFLFSLGIGCVSTILNTMARDTWLTLRYILNFWMVATPVLYPIHTIPAKYRDLIYLNPLTSMLELYRWSIFNQGQIHWNYLILTLVIIALTLIAGIFFWHGSRKTFWPIINTTAKYLCRHRAKKCVCFQITG
jgi:lipopolysaccharide transport system permease protein